MFGNSKFVVVVDVAGFNFLFPEDISDTQLKLGSAQYVGK